jgi:hypothetical protein
MPIQILVRNFLKMSAVLILIQYCIGNVFSLLFQEKPAFIPERPKEKKFPNAPEFVRNVMGSSAGAGSGEFHVYRHIRRREYARQEFLHQMSEKVRNIYSY